MSSPPLDTLEACTEWLFSIYQPGRANRESFIEKINKINAFPAKPRVILVAGTNGKGTSCYLLEAILQASGYRTGTFISPHVLTLNERVRLLGKTVDAGIFITAFNRVRALYEHQAINWFEFLAVVGFAIFAEQALDILIIELGIGGRGDILNSLAPFISIVTTIALDHCDLLGDTREAIAYQKSGIYRPHRLAICGDPNPPDSLIDYSRQIEANLLIQKKDFYYHVNESSWTWQSPTLLLEHLPLPHLPLQNASTVLAALTAEPALTVSEAAIREGLANIQIPGRFMPLTQIKGWVDVAHNPEAAIYLANLLKKQAISGRLIALVGMKLNKDIANTLAPMLPLVAEWLVLDFPDQGFASIAKKCIENHNPNVKLTCFNHCETAYAAAAELLDADDRLIVFGSFQTVAAILRLEHMRII